MSKRKKPRLIQARMYMLAAMLLFFSGMYALTPPDTEVTVDFKSAKVETVLKEIRRQSGLNVVYKAELVRQWPTITIRATRKPAIDVLNQVASLVGCECTVSGNIATITPKKTEQTRRQNRITGTVTDDAGEPLVGVTVRTNEPGVMGVSDSDGNFNIEIPTGKHVSSVTFTYVGMKPTTVVYKGGRISARLRQDNTIDDVVVNGIYERRKESFTGAATVVSHDELMRNGSQNLLQNLKNIDPAFKIVDNIDLGSDPNTMPTVQMRGQQSMADIGGTYNGNPNQPLFILDGFETDMTTVYDLDMNRVETVVLLKDAAAKAIYGSKAANGVVVIETRKPEAGKLRITYKGDLNLTVPDLSGYNLCNAMEKYDVDKTFGIYSDSWFWEQYLNKNMAAIARGVNTDWLAQPLRTGVGQCHSVYMEGGDDRMKYGVDLLYNDITGVMKDSDRKTFTGGFTLSYRYKNLIFRNQFNVSLNRSDDSPYGSFSEYTDLNPYWSPYDENGDIKQIAGSTGGGGIIGVTKGNPLWNATIGTKNYSKYTSLTNNFYIEWQVLEHLKLTGRLGLTKNISRRDDFYPASHTRFLSYSDSRFFEKGSYTKTNGESSAVNADITASYSLLAGLNQLYINAGWSISQQQGESVTFTEVGYPNERTDFITSGLGFIENYRPAGYESKSREIGLLSALNYSYDDRYLADLSLRGNGSSRFGKDNHWGSFWSAGIGWNLHKEHFMKDAKWLRQFKLRASTGYTGSQNFSPYQALATFAYYQDSAYDNWIGSYLRALPNDDLKWQKTRDWNVGFDLNILGRFTLRYDYYVQRTTDQLLSLTIPPSMGFTSYKENLGSTENSGMELKTNVNILLDPTHDRYLSVNFSVGHNKNKLKKISNALRAYNDEVDKGLADGTSNKPQVHYIEGESMNSIWAVRSLGIDPATGEEVFLTKDGKLTTEWSTKDQVVCGDAMPKASGSFGLNLDIRGWFLNTSFYYQLGGQTYNQTLVERVENANVSLNVDKRIYDSVWRQPGDKVSFAYHAGKTTKPSSRFVQDLDELRLSTLNMGYDFRHQRFVRRWGLERLKVSFYMDDVFRLSTVKREMGLTYPFARTYSLSVQATF